ncbi:MAG: 16S rRNA (guanine(966)-N(2))-methyltransferase RsmD [Betaproteobacteria bacterium]|nr:16S rRNA (guanine(966)-N(2))-methyltransferase RsmD [Betaproteobacteria bacterium]
MTSQIRIIGGRWRGRSIRFQAEPGLRPTPNRVRETLFNWLGQTLPGYQCLDLYAGSGALGFEALSRGAARVVFVERQRETVRQLRENAARLEAEGAEIVLSEAVTWLQRDQRKFDLVFLDPPFSGQELDRVLPILVARLNPGGLLYCESSGGVSESPFWSEIRAARAGQVTYQLLKPTTGIEVQ